MNGRPPKKALGQGHGGTRILPDGWRFATPREKEWVARNAAAVKLALEASELAGKSAGTSRASEAHDGICRFPIPTNSCGFRSCCFIIRGSLKLTGISTMHLPAMWRPHG